MKFSFQNDASPETEEIYLAGGCLWGVQEFVRHLPGVVKTEAGRANGTSKTTAEPYDGYAECIRTVFDPDQVSTTGLVAYLFEIIDPYSVNRQGPDVGEKYRTGIYSEDTRHLQESRRYIEARADSSKIAVEVLPLDNYVRSDDEHQDRLTRCPEERCHLPRPLLHKYRGC
jgi:peptide-methionine (S)-S-oxide reductase